MRESILKYIFSASSVLLLIMMLISARDAGINCDEVLHYNHSVSVINYFKSHGQDLSALDTPVTQLKYYGQSYDNVVTIIEKIFNIEDIYGFRHQMSSIAGWLTVIVTALFAVWISGYRTGILVIILFALSPTFLGHSQNNLKDIPFALGYISSIFLILKFLNSGKTVHWNEFVLMILSIAFAISIRAGGLLLLCYLFLFALLYYLFTFLKSGNIELALIGKKSLMMLLCTAAAWILSILIWPYALQNPVINVIKSYNVMAHFPGTFKQVFEGRVEWSDFMPWYYLIKSMAITIPVIVIAGLTLFIIFFRKILKDHNAFYWIMILFSLAFPVAFVIFVKSNLYSSWRQFLFVYPVIVIISAEGFVLLFERFTRSGYAMPVIFVILAILSFSPLRFMIMNHRYSYLYYNELAGGLRGANGNFETDYYYVSQTEASKWLLGYLKEKKDTGRIRVKATYSVSWLFRKHQEIETSYFRFEERSMTDWDYAIITNRYIPPYQLKNHLWPPAETIHVVYADGVPLCAVLRRRTKDDLKGYEALQAGNNCEALKYLGQAVKTGARDEMLYYNFGVALHNEGQFAAADSILRKGLEINPESGLIKMYLGNIAKATGKNDEAISWYKKVIDSDRKYFEAYVEMAKLISLSDVKKARDVLRDCLKVNPHYIPAVSELAETYRSSDPGVAAKYDELSRRIQQYH